MPESLTVITQTQRMTVSGSPVAQLVLRTGGVQGVAGADGGISETRVLELIAENSGSAVTAPGTDDGIKIEGGLASLDIISLPDM